MAKLAYEKVADDKNEDYTIMLKGTVSYRFDDHVIQASEIPPWIFS